MILCCGTWHTHEMFIQQPPRGPTPQMAVAATGAVTTRAFPHTARWPARQSHPHWEPQMQVTALNGYSNHEVISGRNRTTSDSSEPLEVLEEGVGPTTTIGVRQLGPQCPPTKQKPKVNLPVTSPTHSPQCVALLMVCLLSNACRSRDHARVIVLSPRNPVESRHSENVVRRKEGGREARPGTRLVLVYALG